MLEKTLWESKSAGAAGHVVPSLDGEDLHLTKIVKISHLSEIEKSYIWVRLWRSQIHVMRAPRTRVAGVQNPTDTSGVHSG